MRAIIKNRSAPILLNGTTVVYYKPKVLEISDYYPYGWVKFHMDYSFEANAGSLFEDWDSSRGTYYTLYRLLDARIGRWYQVEPKLDEYPWQSGYAYVFSNPITSVDIIGEDSIWISKDSKNGKWVFTKTVKAETEEDIFFVDKGNGIVDTVRFGSGEYGGGYGERVNVLWLDIDDKQALGIYHISGAEYWGQGLSYGYVVAPGGKTTSVIKNSNKRIPDGIYKIGPPGSGAKWQQPGIYARWENGRWNYEVGKRGVRFHFAFGTARNWTQGCFVISEDYTVRNGFVRFNPISSWKALVYFDYNMGGYSYIYNNIKVYTGEWLGVLNGVGRLGIKFPKGQVMKYNTLIVKSLSNENN